MKRGMGQRREPGQGHNLAVMPGDFFFTRAGLVVSVGGRCGVQRAPLAAVHEVPSPAVEAKVGLVLGPFLALHLETLCLADLSYQSAKLLYMQEATPAG